MMVRRVAIEDTGRVGLPTVASIVVGMMTVNEILSVTDGVMFAAREPSRRGSCDILGTGSRIARPCNEPIRTHEQRRSVQGDPWRRWQLNIILVLQWMAKGASVQQVASDLGYGSVGSFVTMFRKALGTSPGRYMSGRLS